MAKTSKWFWIIKSHKEAVFFLQERAFQVANLIGALWALSLASGIVTRLLKFGFEARWALHFGILVLTQVLIDCFLWRPPLYSLIFGRLILIALLVALLNADDGICVLKQNGLITKWSKLIRRKSIKVDTKSTHYSIYDVDYIDTVHSTHDKSSSNDEHLYQKSHEWHINPQSNVAHNCHSVIQNPIK